VQVVVDLVLLVLIVMEMEALVVLLLLRSLVQPQDVTELLVLLLEDGFQVAEEDLYTKIHLLEVQAVLAEVVTVIG
jgi:hypothetical protein